MTQNRVSASSEPRDRNAPTNANQIRLQTSRIRQEHRPIRYQLPARLSFRQGQPEFHRDLSGWIRDGKLVWKESVEEGIENAPRAFLKLFKGENFGKMLVKLA